MLLAQYQHVRLRSLCQYSWFFPRPVEWNWFSPGRRAGQASISWDFLPGGSARLSLPLPFLGVRVDKKVGHSFGFCFLTLLLNPVRGHKPTDTSHFQWAQLFLNNVAKPYSLFGLCIYFSIYFGRCSFCCDELLYSRWANLLLLLASSSRCWIPPRKRWKHCPHVVLVWVGRISAGHDDSAPAPLK